MVHFTLTVLTIQTVSSTLPLRETIPSSSADAAPCKRQRLPVLVHCCGIMTYSCNSTSMAALRHLTAPSLSGAGVSQSQTRLEDVGLVVLDEVHYLGDPSRGSVWEEVIINCSKHIQLCAMSATVANADALGGWIDEVSNCAVLSIQELGIPLTWECCMMVEKVWSLLAQHPDTHFVPMHGITVVRARLGVQIASVTNKVNVYIEVHGGCKTVVTRFWLVPFLWQSC